MLPFCYEAGLVSGHASDAAHFMSVATETFVKEVMSSIFSRTRSDAPGDSGSAGLGSHAAWIHTHKYQRQLALEEEAALRGEVTRDKSGLLPIEAKKAAERGPLSMADVRIALEMADCGMGQFPVVTKSLLYNFRDGELENWDDHTWLDEREVVRVKEEDVEMAGDGVDALEPEAALPNGIGQVDLMDIDSDMWWEGAETQDLDFLDGVLDSCLAVGS